MLVQQVDGARDPYKLPLGLPEATDAVRMVGIDPGSRTLVTGVVRGDFREEPRTFRYSPHSV